MSDATPNDNGARPPADPPGARPPIEPPGRVRGEDRYETAAILATRAEDALQDTVYLCAGDGYSDQAAAASVGDGVILLARRDNDTVPRATLSWLHSHQPSRVIPVGGRTAVTTGAYLAAREAAGIE